jgi:hypothetical protein
MPPRSDGVKSEKIPTAVSSAHAVHNPLGASEKILALHFRQALINLIIPRSFFDQSPSVLRKSLADITLGAQ